LLTIHGKGRDGEPSRNGGKAASCSRLGWASGLRAIGTDRWQRVGCDCGSMDEDEGNGGRWSSDRFEGGLSVADRRCNLV